MIASYDEIIYNVCIINIKYTTNVLWTQKTSESTRNKKKTKKKHNYEKETNNKTHKIGS